MQWQRPKWQTRVEWDPSVAPKWDPRAPMTWEEYARVNSTHESVRRSYEARLNPQPNVEQRWQTARANYDPMPHQAACLCAALSAGSSQGTKRTSARLSAIGP